MRYPKLGIAGPSLLLTWSLAAAGAAGAPDPVPGHPQANPTREQLSYWYGVQFGQSLKAAGVADEVATETVARGIKEGIHGKQLSQAEQTRMNAYVSEAMGNQARRNQAAGIEFLKTNAKAKGVVTTASGLEYRIIAPGDTKAAAIRPTDRVTVNYRGKLIDGTEFDSSYSRGVPATFPVNGVIHGWQEALTLMKPGAKWQIWVPQELGYGMGTRPGIPPGSMLSFEVELLSVAPAAPGN